MVPVATGLGPRRSRPLATAQRPLKSRTQPANNDLALRGTTQVGPGSHMGARQKGTRLWRATLRLRKRVVAAAQAVWRVPGSTPERRPLPCGTTMGNWAPRRGRRGGTVHRTSARGAQRRAMGESGGGHNWSCGPGSPRGATADTKGRVARKGSASARCKCDSRQLELPLPGPPSAQHCPFCATFLQKCHMWSVGGVPSGDIQCDVAQCLRKTTPFCPKASFFAMKDRHTARVAPNIVGSCSVWARLLKHGPLYRHAALHYPHATRKAPWCTREWPCPNQIRPSSALQRRHTVASRNGHSHGCHGNNVYVKDVLINIYINL